MIVDFRTFDASLIGQNSPNNHLPEIFRFTNEILKNVCRSQSTYTSSLSCFHSSSFSLTAGNERAFLNPGKCDAQLQKQSLSLKHEGFNFVPQLIGTRVNRNSLTHRPTVGLMLLGSSLPVQRQSVALHKHTGETHTHTMGCYLRHMAASGSV